MSSYLRHVTVMEKQAMADVLYDVDKYVENELKSVDTIPADHTRLREGAAKREDFQKLLKTVEEEERAADEACEVAGVGRSRGHAQAALEKARSEGEVVEGVIGASMRRGEAAVAALSNPQPRAPHPIDIIQGKIRCELEKEMQEDILLRKQRKYARPARMNDEMEHIMANTTAATHDA